MWLEAQLVAFGGDFNKLAQWQTGRAVEDPESQLLPKTASYGCVTSGIDLHLRPPQSSQCQQLVQFQIKRSGTGCTTLVFGLEDPTEVLFLRTGIARTDCSGQTSIVNGPLGMTGDGFGLLMNHFLCSSDTIDGEEFTAESMTATPRTALMRLLHMVVEVY